MPAASSKGGIRGSEPYSLNELHRTTIEAISQRLFLLEAVWAPHITDNEFGGIFAGSISGTHAGGPLGFTDATWHGKCAWSVRTFEHVDPHECKVARLTGECGTPFHPAGIDNPFHDIQKTGEAIIEQYNRKLMDAMNDFDDVRLLVFVWNMAVRRFTIFERYVALCVKERIKWDTSPHGGIDGYEGEVLKFTWSPVGSQLRIIEPVPSNAVRFKITRSPNKIRMDNVLTFARYSSECVEIL